jgi:hypothetical protein
MPTLRTLLAASLLSAAPLLPAVTPAAGDCGVALASLEQAFGAPVQLHDARGDGQTTPRQCRFIGRDVRLDVLQRTDPGADADDLPADGAPEGLPVLAWRRDGVLTQVLVDADAMLRENGALSDARMQRVLATLRALRDGTPVEPLVVDAADCGQRPSCMRSAEPGLLRQNVSGLHWTQVQGPAGDWAAADAYCRSRGDGWRLPSRVELASLADTENGKRNACGRRRCPVSPLFVLDSAGVWSAERDGPLQRWSADLALQREHPMNPDYTANGVLCVREGA